MNSCSYVCVCIFRNAIACDAHFVRQGPPKMTLASMMFHEVCALRRDDPCILRGQGRVKQTHANLRFRIFRCKAFLEPTISCDPGRILRDQGRVK